jgi:hypothetical protein
MKQKQQQSARDPRDLNITAALEYLFPRASKPNRIDKEVASLTGATILHAVVCDGTPVLIVQLASGERRQVEAWQDPEGNGSGYLSVGAVLRG